MKKLILCFSLASVASYTNAQLRLDYQKPPKEILDIVDYERAPTSSIDSKKEYIVFYYRNTYKTLEDLAETELKLAGLRINPKTNIRSSIIYRNNIKYKRLRDADVKQVEGLPQNAKIANYLWSPDETKIAFTNTTSKGLELWYFSLETGQAHKLSEAGLNANLSSPITWARDSERLLVKMLPQDRKALINKEDVIPEGPVISISVKGEKAQNRTYQDLLSNKIDEENFETITQSELWMVDLKGKASKWKDKAIYDGESFSPDGNYVLVSAIHPPYSYIVPYSRFPYSTSVYDLNGNLISEIDDSPLVEVMPQGFMARKKGKRIISWRADVPASLTWVEALDEGDPSVEVPYRDEVFQLDAPFDGDTKSLIKTEKRYSRLIWGNENTAILYDSWWDTREIRAFVFDPSNSEREAELLFARNSQDEYNNPGDFNMKRGEYGRYVLDLEGSTTYLIGEGYTAEGQFPFVDEFNLKTKAKNRIYQSNHTDKKLEIVSILNAKKGEYLVKIESPMEYPNLYLLNTKKRMAPLSITQFENPFAKMGNTHKEIVRYKRDDGLDLTGTLYLPANYDREKKAEKLPMIMWAYPTEYKDKASAGQNTTNPSEFIYPYYGSPIYWVMRGYAVLDDAAFPIVGEGDEEPNDSYVKQLVANGKAAIDAIDAMGYIDRQKVAVGGHSYGAFMTANLLSHSDLFAAGIARSGAYNRTLTPFGFQYEQRNYWEVPNVYNAMSPFMSADKMKTPMLLVHGGNDNNTGTHTMQSERYFNALKGFGAPVRLVILPNESHGYAAKESIMHLLWEQDEWLEKYVKNRKLD